MATTPNASLVTLELPLMYVAPNEPLTYVYAQLTNGAALDRLRAQDPEDDEARDCHRGEETGRATEPHGVGRGG